MAVKHKETWPPCRDEEKNGNENTQILQDHHSRSTERAGVLEESSVEKKSSLARVMNESEKTSTLNLMADNYMYWQWKGWIIQSQQELSSEQIQKYLTKPDSS